LKNWNGKANPKSEVASKNWTYVTGADAGGAYETVLDVGSTAAAGHQPWIPGEAAANEEAHKQDVATAVWSAFSGNKVQRMDSKVMRYGHQTGFEQTAAGMLASTKYLGQCTAWADLLVQVLAAQGVPAHVANITANFTVKAMPAQGSNGANYTYWGTSTNRPFDFHQVVRVDAYPDKIFDPSYGGPIISSQGADSVEIVYEDQNIVKVKSGTAWPAQTVHFLDLTFDS
jgi:hypothetical protein